MAHEQIVEDLSNDLRLIARKLKNRKEFLKKIVERVEELVRKEGTELSYIEHSCHTHIVAELRNFGHFSFHTSLGQTMFGGNTITIYYHTGRSFREGGIDSAYDKEWTPVLKVDFQTGDDFKVVIFDEQRNWQRALVRVLKNEENIAAQIKRKKEEAKTAKARNRAAEEKKKKLLEEAKKLGVV